MSAVGAEYADVQLSLHQCTAATSWAHCPHGAVSPVTALRKNGINDAKLKMERLRDLSRSLGAVQCWVWEAD